MRKLGSPYGTEVKAPGSLRSMASSAWNIGGKPKAAVTTKPARNKTPIAESMEKAPPPEKKTYYQDLLESLHNPQRGSRISVPGA